jgi:uncharacterized membrane protein YheB (UPF0754 family)
MTEEKKSSFMDELSRLARQLNEEVKKFQESESTKKVLQDLQAQVAEAQRSVEALLQSDDVARMKESLRHLNEDFESGKIQGELKRSALQGLKELDAGIQKLIQSLEEGQGKE